MLPQFVNRNPTLTYRLIILFSLGIITPLGFASKSYQGVLAWWVNDYAGDVLYEIFWILLIVLVWPQASIFWTAFWVLIVTSLIEFFQLWQPPYLAEIRSTFWWRMLLGTTFSWWDFPNYLLGCFLSWICLEYARAKIFLKTPPQT